MCFVLTCPGLQQETSQKLNRTEHSISLEINSLSIVPFLKKLNESFLLYSCLTCEPEAINNFNRCVFKENDFCISE